MTEQEWHHGLSGFSYHGSDLHGVEHFTWFCLCGWDSEMRSVDPGQEMFTEHLAEAVAARVAEAKAEFAEGLVRMFDDPEPWQNPKRAIRQALEAGGES